MGIKLDDVKVRNIRALRKAGFSQGSIARLFDVTKEAAIQLIKGRTWRYIQHQDVPLPLIPLADAIKLRFGRGLTAEQRCQIETYQQQLTVHIESAAEREIASADLLLTWAGYPKVDNQ
jgi:hypothetical protein